MRLGAFEVKEPLPALREPHALAVLSPWIDAGSVGTLAVSALASRYGARELAQLAKPGAFYDFTRYRPFTYLEHGKRQMTIPNAVVSYARREKGNDLVLLRLLEPHVFGEVFVDSVLRVLQALGVRRYCQFGSVYDLVPHTRPLLLSGLSAGASAAHDLERAGVPPSDYQGPTTIAMLISQRAPDLGMDTMSCIVHLPQYAQTDEDYSGYLRLMEVVGALYDVPVDEADLERAEQHRVKVDGEVRQDPRLASVVKHLENLYDSRQKERQGPEPPRLAPEVERFLREMDRRFRSN